MPDAPYRFTRMQWQTNTSLMAPLPSGMPLSLNSLPGRSETLAKWPTLCKHLGGRPVQWTIWHGLQDFHSSAQITLVIQIKAEGDEEALVSGISWISLPTTKGLARAKLCGYCTTTLWFQDAKGPFSSTCKPSGVWYECNKEQENGPHGDTWLNSCKWGGCRSTPAVMCTATVLLQLL